MRGGRCFVLIEEDVQDNIKCFKNANNIAEIILYQLSFQQCVSFCSNFSYLIYDILIKSLFSYYKKRMEIIKSTWCLPAGEKFKVIPKLVDKAK